MSQTDFDEVQLSGFDGPPANLSELDHLDALSTDAQTTDDDVQNGPPKKGAEE